MNENNTAAAFAPEQLKTFIGTVIDHLGEQGASDVHVTPDRGIWFVKDKQTVPLEGMEDIQPELVNGLVGVLVKGGLKTIEENGQADASFDSGGAYRGRVAVRQGQNGISMTIRIISREIPTVESLKLPRTLLATVGKPSGLFLFVGQTGSGKSTSIAALVNKVNETQPTAIYTLESPIEYVYPASKSLVIQREVGTHVESFALGIENAKRSHPRIIVVGEILNVETARSALLAAASGHLVVSTMHAGSTAEAIDTLISMFTPAEQPLVRTQIAQVLLSIVTQKLVPRVGGGLAMAQEIAFNTRTFSNLILGNGDGDRSKDMMLVQQYLLGNGRTEQMQAMEASLVDLVRHGTITAETAREASGDVKLVEELLEAAELREADLRSRR